jgi:hypothetical protein
MFHLFSQGKPITEYEQMQSLFVFLKVPNNPSKCWSDHVGWEIVESLHHIVLIAIKCQRHEYPQEQRLNERFKSNFQTRNKMRLHDSKTKTQEFITITQDLRTRTRNVQNKRENESSLC